MKPTVLLTGGFGNLGGRITAAIAATSRWNIKLISRSAVTAPSWAPDAEIIRFDLTSRPLESTICDGVDAVIHLAALDDRAAKSNIDLANDLSGNATRYLIENATRFNVDRFLFMSTAHVYADSLIGNITEDSVTTSTHPYATSHMLGEQALLAAENQITGVRIRCANGFGYPIGSSIELKNTLMNDLCQQVVQTGVITLRSSGTQPRNFVPFGDVAAATIHLLELDKIQLSDGLFNVGSTSSCSVLAMAQLVAERAHRVFRIDCPIVRPEDAETTEPQTLDYSISKLLATGFSPSNSINEEIDGLLRSCFERQSK
jgi:UDP-glucose 4-epimerase